MQYYKQTRFVSPTGKNLYRLPLSLFLSVFSFSALQAQQLPTDKETALHLEQALPITRNIQAHSTTSGLFNIASNDIRIQLRDSETGKPIVGARIEISGQTQEYRSNENGELFLPYQWGGLNCKITIEANGYVRQWMQLADGLNTDQQFFLDKPGRQLGGQLCNDAAGNKGYFSPVTQPEIKGILKLAGKTETGELPFREEKATKNK